MKFSVIMPAYNIETYIIEAIESILNQTHNDIQLIIVNDGSTDNTGIIADDYAKKDDRISVIHKQNEGPSSARNIGLKYAVGDFIYFIDGDDFIDINAFENILFAFSKSSADVICFGIKTLKEPSLIDKNLNLEQKEIYYQRQYLARGEYSGIEFYEKQVVNNSFVCSPCLYVTKRLLIEENNIKFHHGILHEDELFTRLIFINANKILFLDDNFYNRRYRPNSITTASYTKLNAISLLIIAEELCKYNKPPKHYLLNKDIARFYEASITLLEKLTLDNNTIQDDAIKRLSSSPLSKELTKYSSRILALQYLKYNRFIQIAIKFPFIRKLIPFIMPAIK